MMTVVKEMEPCRCNSLTLVAFGLLVSVMVAIIVIQYSTVVQLQTMKTDVTFIKKQLHQQQPKTRHGDIKEALCEQMFQVSRLLVMRTPTSHIML